MLDLHTPAELRKLNMRMEPKLASDIMLRYILVMRQHLCEPPLPPTPHTPWPPLTLHPSSSSTMLPVTLTPVANLASSRLPTTL